MITKFQKEVYNAVRRIPRGRVATYGAVAEAIGKPLAARAVGNALNKNPFRGVPCHRVVCSNGALGGYNRGLKEKVKLLRREKININGKGVVNLSGFAYRFFYGKRRSA